MNIVLLMDGFSIKKHTKGDMPFKTKKGKP